MHLMINRTEQKVKVIGSTEKQVLMTVRHSKVKDSEHSQIETRKNPIINGRMCMGI